MSATVRIEAQPLPYEDRLEPRSADDVELLVIHCTELPDLASARTYGERVLYEATGTGASGHYYVDRDGRVLCWVDPLRCANHVRGHNARSIGIELVNRGRFPDWLDSRAQRMVEPYPEAQVDALLALVATLRASFPHLARVAGHEDLDREEVPASDDPSLRVRRKLDPGPMFPWPRFLRESGLERFAAPAITTSGQ